MGNIAIRRARPEDVARVGTILYEAFENIFSHHRFHHGKRRGGPDRLHRARCK